MSVPERAQDYTQSILLDMIPNEAELTADATVEPGQAYGFFTDTTLCIGCKACEVACKVWNGLESEAGELTGMSYDNTEKLSAENWRHVAFIEQIPVNHAPDVMQPFQSQWLMMSDVCKHCETAPCLEACPTGSIFRTEFDTVVIQESICNGCGYCVPACPFGVVDLNKIKGISQKCTLCYDRLKGGLEPACAKSCPTDSIQFGQIDDLIATAEARVEDLQERGVEDAYLYGAPNSPGATGDLGRLNAFFLLTDRPEVYNLPTAPRRPVRELKSSLLAGLATVAGLAVAAVAILRQRKISAMTTQKAPYGRKRQRSFEPKFQSYEGETYYERPALKRSPYGWMVALYFFVGGLGGAAQLISTLADLFGGRRQQRAVRAGRYIAFVSSILSAILLIADLHKPKRFYNMLRIFRPTSTMSIGVYILSGFGLFTGLTAACQLLLDWRNWGFLRPFAKLTSIPAAVAGVGMSFYTGTLLATTSIPLWTHAPRLLAALFGSSAVATGTAALTLAEKGDQKSSAMTKLALVASGAELLINTQIEESWKAGGVDEPLREEPYKILHHGSKSLGLIAPLGLNTLALLIKSRKVAKLAAVSTLIGGLMLRFMVVLGGRRSSERPRDYFQWAQPEQERPRE